MWEDKKILEVIYFTSIDNKLYSLYKKLSKYINYEFKKNDAIVFIHADSEFHISHDSVGFTTYNIFKIIKSLGLPLFPIYIITNNNNLKQYTDQFNLPNDKFNLIYTFSHPVVYNNVKDILEDQNLNRFHEKNIQHNLLCMIGTRRNHRIQVQKYIKKFNLKIPYSVNNPNNTMKSPIDEEFLEPIEKDIEKINFVYSESLRINENWVSFSSHPLISSLSNIEVENVVINQNIPSLGYDFYNNFAVDFVTETVFDYPHQFLSEKTVRPILCATPFVLLAAQYSLKFLKSHGFKTFSNYWDESYDIIQDPSERFVKVLETVEYISNLDKNSIENIIVEMKEDLCYNQNLMLEYFKNQYPREYLKLNV